MPPLHPCCSDPNNAVLAFADMMRKQIVMPAHLMDDGRHADLNVGRNLFGDFSEVAERIGGELPLAPAACRCRVGCCAALCWAEQGRQPSAAYSLCLSCPSATVLIFCHRTAPSRRHRLPALQCTPPSTTAKSWST